MSNVFTSIPEDKNNLHVNPYDWSHYFNMSCQIGEIKPVFCNKLPPKSSISIQPKFAFQLMPMVFPIQTPIKARVSFYKMPVRALWKHYQDWISSVNQQIHSRYVPPFVSFSDDWTDEQFNAVWGTKSLADFFNIPTTFDGIASGSSGSLGVSYTEDAKFGKNSFYSVGETIAFDDLDVYAPTASGSASINLPLLRINMRQSAGTFVPYSGTYTIIFNLRDGGLPTKVQSLGGRLLVTDKSGQVQSVLDFTNSSNTYNASTGEMVCSYYFGEGVDSPTDESFTIQDHDFYLQLSYFSATGSSYDNPAEIVGAEGTLDTSITIDQVLGYGKSACPWYNHSKFSGLKISGLPWRMYDAVYNTFIRNVRNNPLYDTWDPTLPEYNKVTQLYDLPDGLSDFSVGSKGTAAWPSMAAMLEYATPRYANWELDVFTTAVQSPMEGVAPLVGLSTYATTTTNEDGTQSISLAQYVTDEDGKRYQVNVVTDEDGIQDINYTEVQAVEGRQITSLYQAITQGISIADLRNVNAYTRYLEMNQRRGYRYKDIIEGRYDVKVRFDELLMPEFIGGFTREVRINPVTQTVQTTDSGTYDGTLGSKSGDGFVFGVSDNRITCYCDEASIILGIISFTPVPVYTQHLPKWLLDRDVLDEWSPEFNNLGFQPLLNREVAPIQYFNNASSELDSVFGYQRPWYHLLSQVDTAHGDFRGPLRNFLMHRVFSGAPKLTREFLQVHPDQVNDVFAVTENTDKIFGQIGFDCTVKLGVARDAVPRLE